MSKKLDDIIKKALENIEEDRLVTRDLLEDAMGYLAKDESRHRDIGLTLAKYVETLQRSNEQMVKVATLIAKEEKKEDGISQEEMENLFSAIAEEKDDEV
jgi:ABC-type Zn uptake system ZnuABC Zn-binding protein ZnuA